MIVSISLAVIAGLMFIIMLFVVVGMLKVNSAVAEFRKLVEMVRLQVAPVTHDVTQILSDVRSIVRTAEKEMVKVEDSITAVRDTTRNLRDFEALLQERIERPLLDITAVLSALVKGFRVFWGSVSKK